MNFGNDKQSALKQMINKLLSVVGFLLAVIKQKDEQLKDKYSLVDWIEVKGIGYCRVHLIGTSMVNDYLPSSIVSDDNFIGGFSRVDVRTITNLANLEKEKPKAFIKSINFEDNTIEIEEIGQNKMRAPIAEDIQRTIDKFSKNDVFNLGRIIGEKDVTP